MQLNHVLLCVDVPQMQEIQETTAGTDKTGGKELHMLCIYRKRESEKNNLIFHRENTTNRGRSTQRVIYFNLNVNLNIHPTTPSCLVLWLLLICFFLYSPP